MEIITTIGEEPLALSVNRVADLLDCSKSKVYELIQRGHLEAIKLSDGSKAGIRVLSASLKEFIDSRGVIGEKPLTSAERIAANNHQRKRSSRKWF